MNLLLKEVKQKTYKKKFFSTFNQTNNINDKLIASKLDEYKLKFDMNDIYE